MKVLFKILGSVYILLVTAIVFFPIVCLVKILALLKLNFSNKSKSYFTEVLYGNDKYGFYRGIKCNSFMTLLVLIVLTPYFWLTGKTRRELFIPKKQKLRATPKQASSIVLSQILGNIRGILAISKSIKSDYIFALQPTLMDHGPTTEEDNDLVKNCYEKKVWGFPYVKFFETFYSMFRSTISKDDDLKNNFLDTSQIFKEKKEQRFVDTCHFGDKGQEEIAEFIAEEIIRRDK